MQKSPSGHFSEDQVKKCSGIWWILPTSGDYVLCRWLKERVFLLLCLYHPSTHFTIVYPSLSRWQKRESSLKERHGLLPHVLPSVLLVGDVLRNSECLCPPNACPSDSSVETCCASQYLQLYWGSAIPVVEAFSFYLPLELCSCSHTNGSNWS